MKYFDWNQEKNNKLKQERSISFEDILDCINNGLILDIVENKNKKRYSNQRIFVINIREYVYLVPFVEDDEKIFLKTIIPSRKATKKYLIRTKLKK